MKIRKIGKNETFPYDILLLADPSMEMIKGYIDKGECFVAELDSKIIGVYVLMSKENDTVELVNVAVLEEYQGKGFGKQLIMDAIHVGKLNGYKRLEIGTGNSSIGQLALYQKCGLRIVGVDTDYFVRNYEDEIYENGIQCRDMIRLSLDL